MSVFLGVLLLGAEIVLSIRFFIKFCTIPKYSPTFKSPKLTKYRVLSIICKIFAYLSIRAAINYFISSLWVHTFENSDDAMAVAITGMSASTLLIIVFCIAALKLRDKVEDSYNNCGVKEGLPTDFWYKLYKDRKEFNITRTELSKVSTIPEWKIHEFELNTIQATEWEKDTLNNAIEKIKIDKQEAEKENLNNEVEETQTIQDTPNNIPPIEEKSENLNIAPNTPETPQQNKKKETNVKRIVLSIGFAIFMSVVLPIILMFPLNDNAFSHKEYGAQTTCYVTATGRLYHHLNCSHLSSAIKTTVYEARKQGYTQCGRCNFSNLPYGQVDEYFISWLVAFMPCTAAAVVIIYIANKKQIDTWVRKKMSKKASKKKETIMATATGAPHRKQGEGDIDSLIESLESEIAHFEEEARKRKFAIEQLEAVRKNASQTNLE